MLYPIHPGCTVSSNPRPTTGNNSNTVVLPTVNSPFLLQEMKVTLDAPRILHLIALIGLSSAGAWALVQCLEWTPLAAFGCSCTLVTQLSNLLTQTVGMGTVGAKDCLDENKKKMVKGGNPKKKMATPPKRD